VLVPKRSGRVMGDLDPFITKAVVISADGLALTLRPPLSVLVWRRLREWSLYAGFHQFFISSSTIQLMREAQMERGLFHQANVFEIVT
jgi:hypothetical protein